MIRAGFLLTTLLGAIYASAGLFSSLTEFAIGTVVAMIGVTGWGATAYVADRRAENIEKMRQHRAAVWQRRQQEIDHDFTRWPD